MSDFEIALASSYLARSGQDPVAALIRSVRDIARLRDLMAHGERCAIASATKARNETASGRPNSCDRNA